MRIIIGNNQATQLQWTSPLSLSTALTCQPQTLLKKQSANLAGYNGFGQLGTGDGKECRRFTPVAGLADAATACIVSGENHVCAVARNGDLYFWGRGDNGQLGAGNDFGQGVPQRLTGYQVAHPDQTLRSPYSRASSA